MNLQYYQSQLHGKECRHCKMNDRTVPLEGLDIQMYPHDGGYQVTGMEQRQWLYVVCPWCGYQWSLKKLKIAEL